MRAPAGSRPRDEPPSFRCSALSATLGEPLAGTASRVRRWLLVEHPGRWDHEPLRTAFTRGLGRELHRRAEAARVRILLIKQRARPGAGVRRCFAAYTGVGERRLVAFSAMEPRQLLELDLESLAAQRFQGFGEEVAGPLYLVCTHGKHDACCAREGLPLYGALADRGDVWEATHVGGDRFAGNLICFPDGTYYGRVDPGAARAVIEGHDRGLLSLEHLRGRSCHPSPVQAADRWLRERLGLPRIDDLVPTAHAHADGRHVATFRAADGSEHSVEVTVSHDTPRRLTCKSTEPLRPKTFAVGGRF